VEPSDPDVDAAHGGLVVVNSYSGTLPFKIFRVFLYKQDGVDPTTREKIWGDGYIAPDNNPEQPFYPSVPTIINQTYNGSNPVKDNYLLTGQSMVFTPLEKGNYKLLIVAGSYAWDYYTADPPYVAGSIPINWKRITYDCGEIFVTANAKKVYNFDPYNAGLNDRDTPNGAVKIMFVHGGNTNNGYAGPLDHVQIVTGSIDRRSGNYGTAHFGPTDTAYVYNIDRPTPKNPSIQSSTTDINYGGISHDTEWLKGGFTPLRHVVFDYTKGLRSGDTLIFYLPPGVYGMKVFDSTATTNGWFGRESGRYLDLYLVDEASKTITISWYYPKLQLRTPPSGISYQLPEMRDLTAIDPDTITSTTTTASDGTTTITITNPGTPILSPPTTGEKLQSTIFTKEYSGTIQWYYSTGTDQTVPEGYHYDMGSVNHPKLSPGRYPAAILDTAVATHPVRAGEYYTARIRLRPRDNSGITFATLTASAGSGGNDATPGTLNGSAPFTFGTGSNAYQIRGTGYAMWGRKWIGANGLLKNWAPIGDGSMELLISFRVTQ
jgi:hypothetical protein